jgi:hypothetical protein
MLIRPTNRTGIFQLILSILFFYYVFLIAIETANGFFIYKNIGVLNNAVVGGKLLISLLSLLFLALTSKQIFIKFLVVIAAAFLLVFSHQLWAISDNLRSVNIIFKIFSNFFAIYFIYFLISRTKNGLKKITLIITVNYGFLVFNILLGSAGIGFANYTSSDETAIGGTGFLSAGNEVGVTLLLSFAAMLLCYASNRKVISITIICTIVAGLLVLSKATIIGVVLSTIVFLFYINKTSMVVFVSTSAFILTSTLPLWINYFQLAINRWTYLLNSYGVEAFLLGGHKRVTYIKGYLNFISNEPMYIFTGIGWIGEAENNFFDMVEAFGLLGLAVFLAWGVSLAAGARYFSTSFKYTNTNASFKTVAFVGLLVFVISIMAGHAIQSSLIGPFIGAVCLVHYLFGLKKIGIKN